MRSVLLVPALLVTAVYGNLVIYPKGEKRIHELGSEEKDSILFTCMLEGNQYTGPDSEHYELQWFNVNDRKIISSEGRMFVDKGVNNNSLALTINKVQKDDGGTYTCRAFVNGTVLQADVALMVYKGIRITSSKKQYMINGTNGKVECRVSDTGDFTISISWYKVIKDANNETSWKRISKGHKFKTIKPTRLTVDDPAYLEVHNVSLDDEDIYVCNVKIRDLGRSIPYEIAVFITVPPTFTNGMSAQPLEPVEGRRVVMSCQAEGIPPPLYNFTKYSDASRMDGEMVLMNSTKGTYIIEDVKRGDEGLYVCTAMNQGGSENISVEINVRVPPEIIEPMNVSMEEESDIRLHCVAIGDPAPKLVWHHKSLQEPYTSDQSQKIYVEEDPNEDEELDPENRVYRRTLDLVIPKVKPEQAGEYVCEAVNSKGVAEHTFFLDVTYKPIFGDKVDSHFYGWVGSNTNLTCVANGNPTPKITWYKDGMELKKDDTFDITMGDTSVPLHTISYLTPKVDEFNQATVFGTYRCEAMNIFGKNQVELTFNLAVVPEPAEVVVLKKYPTVLKLELQRPLKEGGQPVTLFMISYTEADDDSPDAVQTKNVSLKVGEDTTVAELTGLTPNTEYTINITAVNNVGPGLPTNLTAMTADYSKPDKVEVISSREGDSDSSYTLRWRVPMTGGAEIRKYRVEYSAIEKVNTSVEPWQAIEVSSDLVTLNVDGEQTTSIKIDKLARNTYYLVKIKAVNRIGSSEVSTFIFKTSVGDEGGVGAASTLHISAATLLLVTMATASRPVLF